MFRERKSPEWKIQPTIDISTASVEYIKSVVLILVDFNRIIMYRQNVINDLLLKGWINLFWICITDFK